MNIESEEQVVACKAAESGACPLAAGCGVAEGAACPLAADQQKCVLPCGMACVQGKRPATVLRHVVLFRFKEGTSAADIAKVEAAFAALPSKIDAIYDYEWGTNVSVEDLAHGYTHCFFVSFLSEEDRAEYLPHPAHKEFGSMLSPYLDEVTVVDYWTQL
jgi:hypothetical protein